VPGESADFCASGWGIFTERKKPTGEQEKFVTGDERALPHLSFAIGHRRIFSYPLFPVCGLASCEQLS
jgi:hypothetical protein